MIELVMHALKQGLIQCDVQQVAQCYLPLDGNEKLRQRGLDVLSNEEVTSIQGAEPPTERVLAFALQGVLEKTRLGSESTPQRKSREDNAKNLVHTACKTMLTRFVVLRGWQVYFNRSREFRDMAFL